PGHAAANEQAPAVVLLHHAPGEGQSQAPAAAFRRVAGLERATLLLQAHAATVIGDDDFDARALLLWFHHHLDHPRSPLHRRHRVREQVLDRPLEQLTADPGRRDLVVTLADHHLAFALRQPAAHVLHRLANHRGDVLELEIGRGAHVTEALRYLGETL